MKTHLKHLHTSNIRTALQSQYIYELQYLYVAFWVPECHSQEFKRAELAMLSAWEGLTPSPLSITATLGDHGCL